jgi:hypothetical protein
MLYKKYERYLLYRVAWCRRVGGYLGQCGQAGKVEKKKA